MELGIFAKTFPRPTLEETLDAVVAHGLKHVQFNLSCVGLPTLPGYLDEKVCAAIARTFRDRGVTMSAISGTFNTALELMFRQGVVPSDLSPLAVKLMSEVRGQPHPGRNLESLERLASCCKWLDTKIITLSTGTHDLSNMWTWHEQNVTRKTWNSVVEAMKLIVEIADRYQVVMAFEPEVSNVVDSVCKARRLLDEVKSPWLKVVLDPANLVRPGDLPRLRGRIGEAFDWLGDDIALVHVKEMNAEGHSGNVAPGQGVLDYGFILNELERVGYNGTLIMHGLSEDQVEPGVKFMRKMMGFSKGTS